MQETFLGIPVRASCHMERQVCLVVWCVCAVYFCACSYVLICDVVCRRCDVKGCSTKQNTICSRRQITPAGKLSITALINSKNNNVPFQLRQLRFKLIRKQKSSVCNHFRRNGICPASPRQPSLRSIGIVWQSLSCPFAICVTCTGSLHSSSIPTSPCLFFFFAHTFSYCYGQRRLALTLWHARIELNAVCKTKF